MLLSALVLLTRRRVLFFHARPDTASVTNSFIAVIKSVSGTNTISAIHCSIPGFISGGKTGMVRLLKNNCSKFPLLVRVTFSIPLLVRVTVSIFCVRSRCASIAVASRGKGASVDPCTAYFLRSPVNSRASQCRVRNDFLRIRRQECLWRHYN